MLAGHIDIADRSGIHGWVHDPGCPGAPVALLIVIDGQLFDRVVANRHRPDVAQAGFGSGRFGFAVTFNPPLLPSRPWLIRVCSEADGEDLPGSPLCIAASDQFDNEARTAFAAAIGNVSDQAVLEERINFLGLQRERLLQKRAEWLLGNSAGARTNLRALVIDIDGVPEPGRDGGSGALVSHMRSLLRIGYEVAFASPEMSDGHALAALRQDGITACHAPRFHSVEEVLRRAEHGFNVVYLHRMATAAAYINLVRRYQPRARLIYSVADLHHLRLARQASVEGAPELMTEAHRIRAQELWAAQAADAVITHSEVEAALLRQVLPAGRVHVMAWSIPCRLPANSFARRSGLAFVGNFRHAANIAAAFLLRTEIMPAVQAADPTITCKLVGQHVPPVLAQSQPGIEAVGQVPDLQSVFDTVRLTVAPLLFGAGLKSKVMVSLAAGLPCVCSPAAAEGLDLPARMHGLIAPNTEATIAAIIKLHRNGSYNRKMARLGFDHASDAFSEARLDAAMRIAVRCDADALVAGAVPIPG